VAEVRCALLPAGKRQELATAVVEGGGRIVDVREADALIWASTEDAGMLRQVLDDNPHLRWVQLPFAGVEPFRDVFDHDRQWTCGKGVYADPVAEHALGLMLAGLRGINRYASRTGWSGPYGKNLLGGRVCLLGGGAITRRLVPLLLPFGVHLTVVRRHPEPLDGVAEVVGMSDRQRAIAEADVVVLALALTPETEGIIDEATLRTMKRDAWLVNVARGRHVDTDALVTALTEGWIGGAALDVTDPEPLPDGHPLWHLENAIVTPHVGNTPEMGIELLSLRIRENVARFGRGEELLGPVDVDLGY